MKFQKRYLLIIPLMMMSMMAYMIHFFWNMAYGYPYGKHTISENIIPKFTEFPLTFSNSFTKKNSLPILGSAVIDINNDGIEELFLGGGYNQKDELVTYSQNGFTSSTAKYKLTKSTSAATYGVAVVDANNDGYDDMYIARDDGVYLYTNQQGNGFVETKLNLSLDIKSTPISIAIADINDDGLPDLFVSMYLKKEYQQGMNIFNKEGYGSQSLLLLNKGDNKFEDITTSAGLRYVHNTFQATFVDLDLDKKPDLVIAYDTGTVKTLKNNGNLTFTDMPNPTTNIFSYPMGIAVGDYDGDGLTDLAFSNIGYMGPMTFMVRGDLRKDQILNDQLMVLHNEGNFKFKDTSKEMKVGNYEFSWGMIFVDFNNDTKEDLVMAQNYIALPPYKIFKAPSRFLLQGDNGFESVEKETGTTNRKYSITPLYADFNNDGQLDLVFANLDDKSRVFINQGNKNSFIGVHLSNQVKNFGARVTVKVGDKKYTKTMTTSQGLASDSSHRLLFGLRDAQKVDSITIEYLNGETKTIENPKMNSYIDINE